MTLSANLSVISLLICCLLPVRAQKTGHPDAHQFIIEGVTIGEDNLDTLQRKLGPTKICHTKEHVSVAGYRNSNEELIFEFSEVGGGDITAFYLRPSSRPSNCPLSDLKSNSSQLLSQGGVHLGMTEEEFAKIFGAPETKSKGEAWKYHWIWTRSLTEEEKKRSALASPGYTASDKTDVSIHVEAHFSNGILRYFYISRLEVS